MKNPVDVWWFVAIDNSADNVKVSGRSREQLRQCLRGQTQASRTTQQLEHCLNHLCPALAHCHVVTLLVFLQHTLMTLVAATFVQ